jgi:hypothetical protein
MLSAPGRVPGRSDLESDSHFGASTPTFAFNAFEREYCLFDPLSLAAESSDYFVNVHCENLTGHAWCRAIDTVCAQNRSF